MTNANPKLLVVDDIKDWRTTISGILQDNGYQVDVADSFPQATKLLATNTYDLALLDLRLDETNEDNIDGLELAKIIQNRRLPVKVIMITGYGTPEVLKKAMEPDSNGRRLVADYLPKGDTDKLVKTVQRVLNQK
jgi:CheY-like chemotaxis protein